MFDIKNREMEPLLLLPFCQDSPQFTSQEYTYLFLYVRDLLVPPWNRGKIFDFEGFCGSEIKYWEPPPRFLDPP